MVMPTKSRFTALKLCCGAAALATVLGLGGCSMFDGGDDHDRHASNRNERYDDRARTGSYGDHSRSDRYDNNGSSGTYERNGSYDRARTGSDDDRSRSGSNDDRSNRSRD
jgi:hypothetical protein